MANGKYNHAETPILFGTKLAVERQNSLSLRERVRVRGSNEDDHQTFIPSP
jgi:hypothetical protein